MSKRHYGLLADFAHPDAMLDAARAARAAGYRRIEAYSPFPVEGIEEVLEHRSNRPYWFGVVGALVGVAIGLGMARIELHLVESLLGQQRQYRAGSHPMQGRIEDFQVPAGGQA